MKLTRKNINQLFDVPGSDGSWVYQLVAVSRTELLFYTFKSSGYSYEIESRQSDGWRHFKPQPQDKRWIKRGWCTGRRAE